MNQSVRPLAAGLELGDEFLIERALGSGTFGITYLVKALKNLGELVKIGHPYVVKELAIVDCVQRGEDGVSLVPFGQTQADRSAYWNYFQNHVDEFEKEARILAQLNHHAIVEVLMIRRANQTAYMIMEFINGKAFSSLIQEKWREKSRGLSWQELRPKVPPLLDALSHVHRANFVHRDLKPANIMLRDNGAPVLIDFGGARTIETAHRSMVLSPGGAGIEQVHNMRVARGDHSGDYVRVGPSADIYGLASCFYTALTAQAPYELGPELQITKQRPRLQDHPNLKRMGLPPKIARAIDWALILQDPAARPQSIESWKPAFGDLIDPANGNEAQRPTSHEDLYQRAEHLRMQSKDANKNAYLAVYRDAADRGNANAAYRLGRLYQDGRDVQKDPYWAENYFLMAAEMGDIRAAFRLAELHLTGGYQSANSKRAYQLLNAAAQDGFGPALNLIGRYHRKGLFVPQDDRTACDWYERALKAGNPDGAHNLAAMYERGIGRPKNKKLSEHLFRAEKQLRSGESIHKIIEESPVIANSLRKV